MNLNSMKIEQFNRIAFQVNIKEYIKCMPRTPILGKIDELSDYSTTSLKSSNHDLRTKQAKTSINRLRGGWGVCGFKRRRRKPSEQRGSKDNYEIGSVNSAEKLNLVRENSENIQSKDTQSQLAEVSPLQNKEIINTQNSQDNANAGEDIEVYKDLQDKKENLEEIKKSEPPDKLYLVEENSGISVNKNLKSQLAGVSSLRIQKDTNTLNSQDNGIGSVNIQMYKDLRHKKENLEETRKSEQPIDSNRPRVKPIITNKDQSSSDNTSTKVLTSSFIDKVLEEIIPLPSAKCELKDLIPICGKMLSIGTQCDLLDINKNESKLASELFCRLPCDEKTCKSIEDLEKQVENFNVILRDLQEELLPAEDLAKFNVIFKHFNEVNDLLMDLKLNCLKLQNIQQHEEKATSPNNHSYSEFCNCGIYKQFCNGNKGNVSENEYMMSSDFVHCFQCASIAQWSSIYDLHNKDDFKIPQCYNGRCYCQHYHLCRPKASSNEESEMTFDSQLFKERIENHENVLADILPNNSQLNRHNRNSLQLSNKQINDLQNQFYKESSSTSIEHYSKARHTAGRDKLIFPRNETSNQFANTSPITYSALPVTTNNLSQRVWEIIDNNFQLTSKNYLKTEKNSTKLNNSNEKINMPDPNETYTRIQSVRVKNLEQQVHIMYGELQRIREGMLTHRDLIRLGNLLERLRELNAILMELRNHYMQQTNLGNQEGTLHRKYPLKQETSNEHLNKSFEEKSERSMYTYQDVRNKNEGQYVYRETDKYLYTRENAGRDQRNSPVAIEYQEKNKGLLKNEQRDEANVSLKTCKELMDETKPPGSILGNYLIRLQDFRTDPELRRQRWERKQQEKLKQLQLRKGYVTDLINKSGSVKEVSNSSTDHNFTKNSSFPIQNDKRKQLINTETDSGLVLDLPLIKNNLSEFVYEIINDIDRDTVALTIVLENEQIYHISVSLISSGHPLSCFLATEEAIQEAKMQSLFRDILTFFVVNKEYSEAQKERILGYSFEFMKMENK